MQVAYNIDQKLVVYKCGEGVSCFGLSPEKAAEIAPELAEQCTGKTSYPLDWTEISSEKYSALHDAFTKERFVTVKGFQVPRGTPRKFVDVVIQAFRERRPVMVEYKEGYEMLPEDGIADESGRVHTCWIGRTTGKVKALLHLERPDSCGGCEFSFHGINNVSLIPA